MKLVVRQHRGQSQPSFYRSTPVNRGWSTQRQTFTVEKCWISRTSCSLSEMWQGGRRRSQLCM